MSDIDDYWLMCWRSLLVGQPANESDRDNLQAATTQVVALLHESLGIHSVSNAQYMQVYQTIQVIKYNFEIVDV